MAHLRIGEKQLLSTSIKRRDFWGFAKRDSAMPLWNNFPTTSARASRNWRENCRLGTPRQRIWLLRFSPSNKGTYLGPGARLFAQLPRRFPKEIARERPSI